MGSKSLYHVEGDTDYLDLEDDQLGLIEKSSDEEDLSEEIRKLIDLPNCLTPIANNDLEAVHEETVVPKCVSPFDMTVRFAIQNSEFVKNRKPAGNYIKKRVKNLRQNYLYQVAKIVKKTKSAFLWEGRQLVKVTLPKEAELPTVSSSAKYMLWIADNKLNWKLD